MCAYIRSLYRGGYFAEPVRPEKWSKVPHRPRILGERKKSQLPESYWERSRALVMLYAGSNERYGSKLSSFIARGCIWCRYELHWHVPDCRSKSWFLCSGFFVLNFWLHLALWIYCARHKLSRTGLKAAGAYLHPAISRTVAQCELI